MGCENDVMLFQTMLKTDFRCPLRNIKTLVNAQATRKNILKAFEDQLKKIREQKKKYPGKYCFIFLFSGHGSQKADQKKGENADEYDDHKDETLVPYDSTFKTGKNDILDDELNKIFQRYLKEKIYVSVVLRLLSFWNGDSWNDENPKS